MVQLISERGAGAAIIVRCERDVTGCGVREYRFPVGVYRFSERAAASRWVYCVSRRGMSFLSGCIVFFGEAWRCSVFCQYARGECVVSVWRCFGTVRMFCCQCAWCDVMRLG